MRRAVVVLVVAGQLAALIMAYQAPHPIFGFQMFSEASDWQADIYRVTAAGERIDIRTDWDYEWSDLVRGRGLGNPFVRHHAASGLVSTFDFLQEALDWVALNTPLDDETHRLEAEVTYWDNGRGPQFRLFISVERSGLSR